MHHYLKVWLQCYQNGHFWPKLRLFALKAGYFLILKSGCRELRKKDVLQEVLRLSHDRSLNKYASIDEEDDFQVRKLHDSSTLSDYHSRFIILGGAGSASHCSVIAIPIISGLS